jgi:4-amino-4-deoxy-L-arabinose transferase-like glycosyltransferase
MILRIMSQAKQLATATSLRNAKESPKKWLVLILILVTSTIIRVHGIQSEPLIFHPVKQYRSAMTARALYYYAMDEGIIPEWKRDVSNANMRDIGVLQPPVESWIAVYLYRLVGSETLWMPRLFSALSWVLGGIFLFLLALRFMPQDAALFSLAFFLLLPFSVVASQSFQIDPLMVTITIIGLYMLVYYDQSRTTSALIIATLFTSMAILLKPISLFILFAGFSGLCLSSSSPRQMVLNWRTLLFFGVSLLPAGLYYGYEIFGVGGALHQQAIKSFIPIYFTEFRFWDGWQKRIRLVMGFTYFIGGLLGTLVFRGRTRIFLLALWAGYFLMCLVFNYTISTHDYYHLLLIPIVALSLGSIVNVILSELKRSGENWYWHTAAMTILAVAIFLTAGTSIQAERRQQTSDAQIYLAQAIGDMVNHSTKTLYLAPEQGHSLLYYGEFSGRYWPYRYDIRDEELWLGRITSAEERFEYLSATFQPEYFIVADRDEFTAQPELKQLLVSRFPVMMETSDYVIFALK